MNGTHEALQDAALLAAQESLSREFAEPVRLGENSFADSVRPKGIVLRCPVLTPLRGIASVVVKSPQEWLLAPEDEPRWARRFNPDLRCFPNPSDRYRQEVAGLRFVSLGVLRIPAPRLLAVDPVHRCVVMEDLGEQKSVLDPLLGHDADAAADAVLALVRAMAQLHSGSVGKENLFAECGGGRHGRDAEAAPFVEGMQRCVEFARAVGLPVPRAVGDASREVRRYFTDSSACMVFSPGDVGPGNQFLADDRITLFDFEFSRYRHMAVELANLTLPFPAASTSSALSAELAAELMDAYFADAAAFGGFRHRERAAAQGFGAAWWTFASVGADLAASVKEDYQWGFAGCRSRHLHKLRLLADLSAPEGAVDTLGRFADELHATVSKLWPDAEDFPVYPAFRSR